ncbi:MAG: ATP-binding protein [Lachnospiraceae bacterium]|nr:ATP-binding protein [Lachnospiraceae bacterium]
MGRIIGIGHEDFSTIIESHNFYIDKTHFIKDWWETNDKVTLITRPRRFGKTLNMSMLETFFSVNYANRKDLFEGMEIWKDEKYRAFQGTYPVLFLSFAGIKENSFAEARCGICRTIEEQYNKYDYLLEGNFLNEKEKAFYQEVSRNMSDSTAAASLRSLSDFLGRYYEKKVIILLDEYDTPMQEAYVNGYWEELAAFTRGVFNSSFKTNPYLERAIMTGITRVSKESVFSDLNNLEVITTTSDKYAEYFGFTEKEVFTALDEFGLSDQKQQVKKWYDGFTFGKSRDIYNPWSIINFLDKKKVGAYWANTSSNSLVNKLVREGNRNIKEAFESLLRGESVRTEIDEQIVYNMLDSDERAVFSLLLAGGYLRVEKFETYAAKSGEWKQEYELELTNYEVKGMFYSMIRGWFGRVYSDYNDFIKALLRDDIKAMNAYMNRVSLEIFSFFDTGKSPSGAEPERFYHGFVLGLMVDLADRYVINSNRESGYGRYDVMLEPRKKQDDAVIMEFKVQEAEEREMSDTVQEALRQIDSQKYEASLVAKGIPKEHIRKYGFAFCGKKVLIGK